jgi:hypothetical protein
MTMYCLNRATSRVYSLRARRDRYIRGIGTDFEFTAMRYQPGTRCRSFRLRGALCFGGHTNDVASQTTNSLLSWMWLRQYPTCQFRALASFSTASKSQHNYDDDINEDGLHHNRASTVTTVEVNDVAQQIRKSVRQYTSSLLNSDDCHPIRLVGVLAQQRMDSAIYSKIIANTCRRDGIDYEEVRCNGETPESVATVIRDLNVRPDVNGILVFYPIFKRLDNPRASVKGPYLNRSLGVRNRFEINSGHLPWWWISRSLESIFHRYILYTLIDFLSH